MSYSQSTSSSSRRGTTQVITPLSSPSSDDVPTENIVKCYQIEDTGKKRSEVLGHAAVVLKSEEEESATSKLLRKHFFPSASSASLRENETIDLDDVVMEDRREDNLLDGKTKCKSSSDLQHYNSGFSFQREKKYEMYVFGGYGNGTYLNDFFVYNVKKQKWKEVKALSVIDEPCVRMWHSAVVYKNEKIIIFGGETTNKKRVNDIYEYSTKTNKWTNITPVNSLSNHASSVNSSNVSIVQPRARCAHSAVMRRNNKMVIFGGAGSGYLNDMYEFDFDVKQWQKIESSNEPPSPRFSHTAVMRKSKDEMVVFGGKTTTSRVNEIWCFNFVQNKWKQIEDAKGDIPCARTVHSAVVVGSIGNDKMILFGGFDGQKKLDDMYQYDFSKNTWTKLVLHDEKQQVLSSPSANHSLVAIGNKRLVLFGGEDANRHYISEMFMMELHPSSKDHRAMKFAKDVKEILLQQKLGCDVTVQIEMTNGKKVPFNCHGCILSQSTFLKELIYEQVEVANNVDQRQNEPISDDTVHIQLNNIKPIVFEQIMAYLYGVSPQINIETIVEVVKEADRFNLQNMVGWCLKKMSSLITVENVIPLILKAEEHEQKDIQDRCIDFIVAHLHILPFQKEFIEMSKEMMVRIFQAIQKSVTITAEVPISPVVSLFEHIQNLRTRSNELKSAKEALKGTLSDTVLTSEDEKNFFVHKPILICNSGFFSSLFNGTFEESSRKTLDLSEIHGSPLSILLDYIYGLPINHKKMSVEQLMQAAIASNYAILPELEKKCVNELKKRLNKTNAIELLKFSSKISSAHELKKKCMEILSKEDLVSVIEQLL